MDFVTTHFGKMNLWPVEHFYDIFVLTFGSDCYCIQQSRPKVRTNMLWKWSTGQSFIFPKWHSFKIGTLTPFLCEKSLFQSDLFAIWLVTLFQYQSFGFTFGQLSPILCEKASLRLNFCHHTVKLFPFIILISNFTVLWNGWIEFKVTALYSKTLINLFTTLFKWQYQVP